MVHLKKNKRLNSSNIIEYENEDKISKLEIDMWKKWKWLCFEIDFFVLRGKNEERKKNEANYVPILNITRRTTQKLRSSSQLK